MHNPLPSFPTTPPLPRYSTAGPVERYRYPSQRHLTPTHCGNCGARLLLSDVPTADAPLVDVTCLYCSRVCAELIYDGLRRPMTPEELRALPSQKSQRGPVPPDGIAVDRLIKLLQLGGPMHQDYLAGRLRMSVNVLHNAVWQARQRGYEITTTKQGYRLEVQP